MPEKTPKHIVLKQFERIVVLKGACNCFNRLLYFDEDHSGDCRFGYPGKRLGRFLDGGYVLGMG